MDNFTYLTPIVADPNWQKFVVGCGVMGGLVALGLKLSPKLQTSSGNADYIVPEERITTFGIVDLAVERWVKFQDSILGKENRKHAPLTAAIFFFVFLSNLIGLIPGMPAVTTTVWVNVGMAITVFIYFNLCGIKEHGFSNYLKHFAGPVWWLVWLIFPLEIFSTTLRILTLNLRLYWNISADHVVLSIFTELVPFGIPVLFYALGAFVALMQAFIFSLLTMVYILLATQHEESEEQHH